MISDLFPSHLFLTQIDFAFSSNNVLLIPTRKNNKRQSYNYKDKGNLVNVKHKIRDALTRISQVNLQISM